MHRRAKRGLVTGLMLIGVPTVLYFTLFGLLAPDDLRDRDSWLLAALSLALIVLTLGLAGVLIRNLVKLIIDRRRGVLGAALRFKLVFFFLALILVPAIVLFAGSAHIIKQTVGAILREPVEHLKRGDTIVDAWRGYFKQRVLSDAGEVAQEVTQSGLLDPGQRAGLARLLDLSAERLAPAMVRVVVDGRNVATAESGIDSSVRDELSALIEAAVDEARLEAPPWERFDRFDDGLMAQAMVPIDDARYSGSGFLSLAILLPDELALSINDIHAAVSSYDRMRYKRRDLEGFYLTLIGLIFVATLFVATWIGWYVARRITEPVQAVAAAAREISAGNMDVRVNAQDVGDEMAILIESFNEMAGELQENRAVITRSTAELRRSNMALHERRRYIETLVAKLSTAVISLDTEGAVTTSNPAVKEILGLELAVGDSAPAAFEQAELVALVELLQSADADSSGVRADIELPESAPKQHVSVQLSSLEGRDGEALGSLLMVEDLSDMRRAQRAQAWQDVARRIAHEIKNPLTPIQLSAQRLRKKFFARSEDLDDVLVDATATIEREVSGLKQLVDEFSRFSRMPQIEPKSVEFSSIVESVLSLYRGLSAVEWRVDQADDVGTVHVDPQQMRRALINLIDNAISAMEQRGSISISTRRQPATGRLQIEVADSGPGIPVADRDKMFAPYFSTKKRGTGLGLAIVHKVVADHAGTIRVEDNEPQGARFVIELPR